VPIHTEGGEVRGSLAKELETSLGQHSKRPCLTKLKQKFYKFNVVYVQPYLLYRLPKYERLYVRALDFSLNAK
jgi:hypothetical protein